MTNPAAAGPTLAAPARLTSDPDFGRLALAANDHRQSQPISLTLRIRGIDPAWRSSTSGVAISSRDGGSGLIWLPLADASLEAGSCTLRHRLPKSEEILVAVASTRACALHGYLARAAFRVTTDTTLDLDASAARIAFRQPGANQQRGPFRLVRSDDPHWLPMDVATAGLVLPHANDQIWLGHGSYELCDPIHNERRQRFDVPATTLVEISATLAPRAADRP